ncbi:MAG: hypothetical protein HY077_14250 [Elusimicrobia bacterium]|nr:hypothetical protein [Elusimicrobiota bacterium]
MRKIIGFKLGLRIKEIQRRAKKAKLDLESAGLGEAPLQALLDKAAKALKPAVIFETYSHQDIDQNALSSMPGLAYSVILATLGEGFSAFAVQAACESESHAKLWPLVCDVALEDAVAFASRLLQDDAENDACELSPLSPVSEPAAVEAAVRKLEAGKIGVSLAEGRLRPEASLAVSLSWLSKSKAKGKAKP